MTTDMTFAEALRELKTLSEELGEESEGVCHDPGERIAACLRALKIVRVGTAVMIRDQQGRLLFGLRKGTHCPGTWSFPGGAVDFGESPVECARREIREETGLEVGDIVPFEPLPYVNTHFDNGSQWVTCYFVAEYLGGEPRVIEPEKCERWEWFPFDALPSPVFEAIQKWPEAWATTLRLHPKVSLSSPPSLFKSEELSPEEKEAVIRLTRDKS